MKNIKMKNKVVFGIVIIVIINILLGLITSIIDRNIRARNSIIISEMSIIHNLKDGQVFYINWNNDLNELIEYNSPFNAELDPFQSDFGIWITDFRESDEYTKLPEELRQQISLINQYFLDLHRVTSEAIDDYRQGNKTAALLLSDNDVKDYLNYMLDSIVKTEAEILKLVDANKKAVTDFTLGINSFSLLAVLISAITAGTIILFLVKVTFQPLSELISRIKSMNEEEVYQEITDTHYNNEMGSLLYVFNNMIRKVNYQQSKLQEQYEELLAQGEEVAAQNEELAAQGDELAAQNNKILEQKQIMQETIHQLKNHEEQLKKLYQFSKSLTETMDLDRLIERSIEGLLDEMNAQTGVLYLFNLAESLLEAKYSTGISRLTELPALYLGEGLVGRSALQKKAIIVNYEQSQLKSQSIWGEIKNACEIYQPLIIQERLLGVLVIGRVGDGKFSASEQELLTSLTDQISIALDNTANYKQTQEALTKIQELDKLKSEMINTVSHELRTPLASILGFTELMLKKSPDEVKARKYLTTIYSEAERLKLLINDFLDLQKIETGRFEFTKQQVNMKELLQDSIGLYEGQGNDSHPISLYIDGDLPEVMTDPDKITQVVGNLLSNAIKYSPKGGPVEVSVSRYNSNQLIVSVKDCGLGIPEDAQKKLFQPFYRVDNSDRREIGGTGLGLAICYKIITALGGKIWVESIHGKGSTFHFTLPSSDFQIISKQELKGPVKYINNEKDLILIAEDDESLSSLLSEALQDEGYETVTFDNGPSTIEFLENQEPKAIILDIILNGPFDGWEILRRLKQGENTRNIPVIISSSIDQKNKAEEYHVADYLVKPFTPEKLLKSIASILKVNGGYVGIPHTEQPPNSEGEIKQLLNDNGFTVRDIKKDQDVFVTDIVPKALDK